jgi:hypothetical protein
MPEQKPTAEEFFYLDKDGNKQDAELHNPILNAVDAQTDEKIMKPIRDRHRAAWLAEQEKATKQKRWQRAKALAQKLLGKT